MASRLTLDEQEIIITMNGRTDTISIYTSYPHWIKRLDKYCEENPGQWKCTDVGTVNGEVVSKSYTAPKEFLKLQKRKRYVSEEQRKASAERLAKYRKESQRTE